jgi:hypothetical protein
MARGRLKRWLDRWVEPDAQKIFAGMFLVALLALAGWGALRLRFPGPSEPYRKVDKAALATRVARERPADMTPDAAVAFLRTLGFEDRYIRITRFVPPHLRAGGVIAVEGWIPQPHTFFWGRDRLVVSCGFNYNNQGCSLSEDLPYGTPWPSGIAGHTPVPAR